MPPYQKRVPFPAWVPDLSDQETATSQDVQNVLARADGWGPFPSFQAFSQSLPAPCQGFFKGVNADGSVAIFAGTATNLYLLNDNTLTWTNVSLGGGPYAGLGTAQNWSFCQFNSLIIAVQFSVVPQVFTLGSSTAFANLAGSPPQASFVAVVNRFIFLSGINGNPYRLQWSDLDNPTQWTAGVGQSDFQDLPDGGITLGIAGFDLFAVAFQTSMARLITYAPGSPVIFTITKITGGDGNGLYAPYGWVVDQDQVFWLSQEGMKFMPPGGSPTPIGKEVVDRYIFANIDNGSLQLCIATTDPATSRIFLAFKSLAGQFGLYDTVLVYDWVLQRWSRLFVTGQYLGNMSRPGLTLEQMDLVTPGAVAISGFAAGASNGAGGNYVRVTVSATAGMSTAKQQTVYGTWNITLVNTIFGNCNAALQNSICNVQNNANAAWGSWPITIIDGTHVDLVGSLWNAASTYTSGGVLGGNIELIPFSFDDVATATLATLAQFNPSNVLGFFTGPNTAATIETAEYGTNEKRTFVRGFRVITDAPAVNGSVSYRDNPQASYNYTLPIGIDQTGTCLVAGGGIDSRYSRAMVQIPAGTAWTYLMAIEPDVDLTGTY